MAVIYRSPENKTQVFAKGAVERILECCEKFAWGDKSEPITNEHKDEILRQMNLLADQGLRVLALAHCDYNGNHAEAEYKEIPRAEIESGYTFLGLVGIYDPPRLETKDSVRACTLAGIKVHMLTGGKNYIPRFLIDR